MSEHDTWEVCPSYLITRTHLCAFFLALLLFWHSPNVALWLACFLRAFQGGMPISPHPTESMCAFLRCCVDLQTLLAFLLTHADSHACMSQGA